MATITAQRFIELKNKIKAECQRRCHTGSVATYGDASYDFSNVPSSSATIKKEHYEKIAVPLNAINTSFGNSYGVSKLIIDSNSLTQAEQRISDYALIGLEASSTGTGCSSSCTGLCSTTCTGSCSNTCSSTCTGSCTNTCTNTCTNNCKGSCGTSCSKNCASYSSCDCGSNCSGGCRTSCSGACKGDSACTGGCSGGCSGSCSDGNKCKGGCGSGCTGYCSGSCSGGCYSASRSCDGNQ